MFRTYMQKSSVFEILENVDNLCRLCLEEDKDMVPIFNADDDFHYEKTVFRIMFCVGIEVKKQSNIPQNICTTCFTKINNIYDFKKKCERSNRKLNQHLHALETQEESRKCEESVLMKDIKYVTNKAENINFPIDGDPMQVDKADYTVSNTNGATSASKAKRKQLCEESTALHTRKELPRRILQKLKDAGVLMAQHNRLSIPKKSEICFDDVVIKLVTSDNSIMSLELSEEGEELIAKNSRSLHISDKVADSFDCDKPLELKYKCDLCKKRYETIRALCRHRLSHSRARPYKCDTCSKTFAQKEVLQRHLMVHTALGLRRHEMFHCEASRLHHDLASLLRHYSLRHVNKKPPEFDSRNMPIEISP